MSRTKLVLVAVLLTVGVGSTIAYAKFNERQVHDYYPGHWHDEHGDAVNAPSHSGGTDVFGCHNASVPYHCH
jgi:hypothetical protein